MSEKTFEQNISELEAIVSKLEAGNVSLEESMSLFEQGVSLTNACTKQLSAMEQKVEKLTKQMDGSMKAEAFTPEGE